MLLNFLFAFSAVFIRGGVFCRLAAPSVFHYLFNGQYDDCRRCRDYEHIWYGRNKPYRKRAESSADAEKILGEFFFELSEKSGVFNRQSLPLDLVYRDLDLGIFDQAVIILYRSFVAVKVCVYLSDLILNLNYIRNFIGFFENGEQSLSLRFTRIDASLNAGIIRGYNTTIYMEDEVVMIMDIETTLAGFDYVLEYLGKHTAFVRQIFTTTKPCHIHAIAAGSIRDLKYLQTMIQKKCGEYMLDQGFTCHAIRDIVKDVYGGVRYDDWKCKIQQDEGDIQ